MRAGPAIPVHIVEGGLVKGEGELQSGGDGRWTGSIVLDGVTWAAADVPHADRLLADLVVAVSEAASGRA